MKLGIMAGYSGATGRDLHGAKYNANTQWPEGFLWAELVRSKEEGNSEFPKVAPRNRRDEDWEAMNDMDADLYL